jgi:tetratricopeptide (TPR) repeat protein
MGVSAGIEHPKILSATEVLSRCRRHLFCSFPLALPPQHPNIAMTLENIGLVYEDKNNFPQAHSYFEKAAKIYHHSLPSTHPHIINIDQCITRISSKM